MLELLSLVTIHASSDSTVRLLVKCEGGPSSRLARAADAAVGAIAVRQFEAIGWHLVQLPDGVSVAQGVKSYRGQPGVLNVEPNYTPKPQTRLLSEPGVAFDPNDLSRSSNHPRPSLPSLALNSSAPTRVVPNDPQYSSQWNLKKIAIEQAWAITTGDTNVVVAVLDSGVNYLHPDLVENMWKNPGETGLDAQGRDKATNDIDDDENGYVDDVFGINTVENTSDPMDLGFTRPDLAGPAAHGTFCAGVIAGIGNNGTGMTGINWRARIMGLRIIGGNLVRTFTSNKSRFLEAMEYIIQMKRHGINVRIVSMSDSDDIYSQAFVDSVRTAGDEGILCVFSAGNEGWNLDAIQWRSTADDLFNLITVGGSDRSDGLIFNYGSTSVDLVAPARDIVTTGFEETYVTGFYGTSAACPHVAGAAALLAAAMPDISVAQLRTALLGSVDLLPTAKGKIVTGGRLNVLRALQSLTNSSRAPIVIWSSPAGMRADTNAPIKVTFSQPMDRASVEQALIINPPVEGIFEWSADNRQFTFRHPAALPRTNHTCRIAATAKDAEGRALDGNFDRLIQGSPSDDYLWTFRFPLPNDAFAGAERIAGEEGSVSGNNSTAIVEAGEAPPNGYVFWNYDASVWYRWRAPRSGWFTLDLTKGTSFNSLLTVFTGEELVGLTEVASNIDYGSQNTSRLSFSAAAETEYAIAVAGTWPQTGKFNLRWYPTPAPTISSISALSGTDGQVVTLLGTNLTGVTNVDFNGLPLSFTHSTNPNFVDLSLLVTLPSKSFESPATGLFKLESLYGSAAASNQFTFVPAPALAVEPGPDGVVIISWRDDAKDMLLEATELLGSPSVWQPVVLPDANPPIRGRVRRAASPLNGSRFYRLRRP